MQLDQLAIIYSQAVFTIVAAEGNGAEQGSAGVSRSRIVPNSVQLHERFWLVEACSSLNKVPEASTWLMRGWTYQEYLVSPNLLLFINHGLYFNRRSFDQSGAEDKTEKNSPKGHGDPCRSALTT